VRLVVGVDDLFLDPAASVYVHALGLGPGADLRDVIPSAAATSAPAVSPTCWRGLSLNTAAFLDVCTKCIVESLGILIGEIDLVVLSVDRVGDGFGGFGFVQVVDKNYTLCHDSSSDGSTITRQYKS
jgi:hypothetical protein